jgi:hypothetical protein
LRQELSTRKFERRRRNAATLRASTPRTASHDRGNRLHAAAGSITPLQCVDLGACSAPKHLVPLELGRCTLTIELG